MESSIYPFKKSDTTNPDLLSRGRIDDPAAWNELVTRYSPLIYHRARQMGLQQADAANVVQETFQSVMKHLKSFEARSTKGSFRSWLKTITVNKARDQLRKRLKQTQAVGGTDWQQNIGNIADELQMLSSESIETMQDKNQALNAALDLVQANVNPRTFQAFCMLVLEGRSSAEVAQELDMTNPAVRMAKLRVIQKLKKLYKGQNKESS